MTTRVLGIPKATLGNWIRAYKRSELQGAGARPVSAEQMELARLRAELARVNALRDAQAMGRWGQRRRQYVACLQAFTGDIERMADWLVSTGSRTVAMESTGLYWVPVFELLRSRGIEVVVAKARGSSGA